MRQTKSLCRKIKEWVLPIILGVVFCFLLFTLPKIHDVCFFLTSNSIGLILFFIALIVCSIISFTNYYRTLGPFEEETEATGSTMEKNKKMWIFFWGLWSIYFSIITISYEEFSWRIFLSSSILCIVPCLLSYSFAWQVRRDEIKQEEDEKNRLCEKYVAKEAYNIFIKEKYQNGLYALICSNFSILVGKFNFSQS